MWPGEARVVALQTADHRAGQRACQVRILAEALRDPPPPRVPGDVHHRCERPLDALRTRFRGRRCGRLANQLRVPTCRLAERDRKDGAVAVDHVTPEHQRDTQPALFHRDLLDCVGQPHAGLVHHRAELTLAHELVHLAAGDQMFHVAGRLAADPIHLPHLPDLLVERHLREQGLSAGVDRQAHVEPGSLAYIPGVGGSRRGLSVTSPARCREREDDTHRQKDGTKTLRPGDVKHEHIGSPKVGKQGKLGALIVEHAASPRKLLGPPKQPAFGWHALRLCEGRGEPALSESSPHVEGSCCRSRSAQAESPRTIAHWTIPNLRRDQPDDGERDWRGCSQSSDGP